MKNLINKLHKSNFLGAVIHTLDYCLQRELSDCESVLDLGCGPSSPLQHCRNVKYSLGVEAFSPYLEESKKKKIHTEYSDKKIEDLDFPENSFDAVIMIEVLEHLPEEAGLEILKKAEKWAKKKVVVSSPNGFVAQKAVDGNELQKHLSGWDCEKMKKLGFVSNGLAGLKFLRQEVQNDTMGDDLMTSIKFKPKFFWFGIATLSQILVYYIPFLAFELFSVKNVEKKK
jgi:SAM-dependent methyltransferase